MDLSDHDDDTQRRWRELLAGETAIVWHLLQDGVQRSRAFPSTGDASALTPTLSQRERGLIIFPGSFNPLHAGHRRMAEVAAEMLDMPVAFEIFVHNVDKPPLTSEEIARRLSHFAPHDLVCLTRAATFVEKARLFPRATFIVGADTILRIAAAHYYAGKAARDAAIAQIAARECRFLVFGRQISGGFLMLGELPLPADLAALCHGVPSDQFRFDISSTERRNPAYEFGP